MSMLRTMFGLSMFMILLNIIAYSFAQTLPGNVVSTGSVVEYEQTFGSFEQNTTVTIDTSNIVGFVVDATRAVTNLNLIVSTLFGGYTLASLLHLPSQVAVWINVVEGVVYTIALFLFFSGRAD